MIDYFERLIILQGVFRWTSEKQYEGVYLPFIVKMKIIMIKIGELK